MSDSDKSCIDIYLKKKKGKQRLGTESDRDGFILDQVVRAGLLERWTYKQIPKWSEGGTHVYLGVLGRENSRCKAVELERSWHL